MASSPRSLRIWIIALIIISSAAASDDKNDDTQVPLLNRVRPPTGVLRMFHYTTEVLGQRVGPYLRLENPRFLTMTAESGGASTSGTTTSNVGETSMSQTPAAEVEAAEAPSEIETLDSEVEATASEIEVTVPEVEVIPASNGLLQRLRNLYSQLQGCMSNAAYVALLTVTCLIAAEAMKICNDKDLPIEKKWVDVLIFVGVGVMVFGIFARVYQGRWSYQAIVISVGLICLTDNGH